MARRRDKTLSEKAILDAAIHCLVTSGDRGATFQAIAERAKVSQGLVVHYFKSRDQVFVRVFGKLLENARQATAEALKELSDPREKLTHYLRTSYLINRETPEISKLYLMFYHLSAFDPVLQKWNLEIKSVAVRRIAEILEEGIKKGAFAAENPTLTAKLIHTSLVGLLLNLATEENSETGEIYLRELDRQLTRALAHGR